MSIHVSVLLKCARCGLTHADITFERLMNPPDEYEWWAPCPYNGQPILLRRASDQEVENAEKEGNTNYIAPENYEATPEVVGLTLHRNPDPNGAESG